MYQPVEAFESALDGLRQLVIVGGCGTLEIDGVDGWLGTAGLFYLCLLYTSDAADDT